MSPCAVASESVSRPQAPRCKLSFASAACSRRPRALSILPSQQLAAYISDCNVFIVDILACKVVDAISIRTSLLNAVKLVLHEGTPFVLVCADDGYVTLCRPSTVAGEAHPSFVVLSSHAIFSTPCLAFDVISTNPIQGGLFVTAVSEHDIATCVIPVTGDEPAHKIVSMNRLPLPKDGQVHLCHDVALHPVGSSFFIALGGTERLVRLFHTTGIDDDLTLLVNIPAHRDWVRTLAFVTDSNGDTILATASTDCTVRLFRVQIASSDIPIQPLRLRFTLGAEMWFVQSFALLDEHSATVHTVTFAPSLTSQSARSFLTASLDGTVAVWSLSPQPTCVARFGLMGGHAAHASGFFAAGFLTSTSPYTILAASFSGAFHRWEERATSESSKSFVSRPAFGGHHATVSCVRWAPNGAFLMSASKDKTVRIFANGPSGLVECARPQVHGHAVNAVAFCDMSGARYVSASEERMLRVFDAPNSFTLPNGESLRTHVDQKTTSSAVGAVLPELGLSNKAVLSTNEDTGSHVKEDKSGGSEEGDMDSGLRIVSIGADRSLEPIPLEDELKQSLLWPEVAKLYGHGNEITCLTSHIPSATIASAGKGFSVCDATILIWDANTGVEAASMKTHDYSVVALRFSPDGRKLVSVGKDRTISIHERAGLSGVKRFDFYQVCNIPNAHKREIFGCSWLGTDIIASGARDKMVKLFSAVTVGSVAAGAEISKLKLSESVTAIDSTHVPSSLGNHNHVLAIGLDSGGVVLASVSLNGDGIAEISEMFSTGERMKCGSSVTSLHWRPGVCNDENDGSLSAVPKLTKDLAIGSKDQSLRVISFDLR